jgi:DNA topoisomerase-2
LIENPSFDSQTKENMTLKSSSFGSSFSLSEKFLKDVIKTGIVDHCVSFAKAREELKMTKQLNAGSRKTGRLLGIPKLDDANNAGTKNSHFCTLILTEGDSAKSLAMAGIEIVGRDNFGVFPLKGKLLNVREAKNLQITNNEEIQNLIKILGLQVGKQYEETKNLRYSSIMIMTDQGNN